MPTVPERIETATDQLEGASQQAHDISNGDDQTDVPTDNGPVKSYAKSIRLKEEEFSPRLIAVENHAADVTTDPHNVEGKIAASADKATPIDADEVVLVDSAAAGALKKLTWANLKTVLKTFFDTLYVNLTTAQTIAGAKTFDDEVTAPTGLFLNGTSTGTISIGGDVNTQERTTDVRKLGAITAREYENLRNVELISFDSTNATNGFMYVGGRPGGGQYAPTSVSIGTRANTSTQGSATAIFVDSMQMVGIGKTNPIVPLDVSGDVAMDAAVNLSGLAEYADDTAAGVGGLVTGDLYTTTGAIKIKL
jgi:hypothetical protein